MREADCASEFAGAEQVGSDRPSLRARLLLLGAILVLCGGLRGSLMMTAGTIAKDGTVYIRMAREWPSDAGGVIRRHDFSVGYPLAILGTHRLLTASGLVRGEPASPAAVGGWELAGQLVSLAASLLALAGGWLLAERAVGWQAGSLGVLLFGLSRKWSVLGADVLSDALAACLMIWAVVLALAALDLLRSHSQRAWAVAAAAGLCSGAGYLVRPEGLLAVGLAGLLWLACWLRREIRLVSALAALIIMSLAAGAVAAPYMAAVGGISKKKSIARLLLGDRTAIGRRPAESSAASQSASMTASDASAQAVAKPRPRPAPLRGYGASAKALLARSVEAMHPVCAGLMGVWLMTWIGFRILRFRPPEATRLSPRWDCGLVMAAATASMSVLLIGLFRHHGYISHRHAMFPALLLSGLAGAGLMILLAWARVGVDRLKVSPAVSAWFRAAPTVLVALLFVAVAAHAARPIHQGTELRQAGLAINALAGPDDYLLAIDSRVVHYAQLPGEFPSGRGITAGVLRRRILAADQKPVTLLAVAEEELARDNNALDDNLRPPAFVELGRFPGSADAADRVRVYRVNRDVLAATPDRQPLPLERPIQPDEQP